MLEHPFDNRGFTLVETIIAATLLATAIIAVAQLVAIAARQSAANRRALSALIDAQSKLEALRAVPWRMGMDTLAPSPPDALVTDRTNYWDITHGLIRRWRVSPLPGGRPDVVVLGVCVYGGPEATMAEACVSTVRTRRP